MVRLFLTIRLGSTALPRISPAGWLIDFNPIDQLLRILICLSQVGFSSLT
jgi:hypothetical protein